MKRFITTVFGVAIFFVGVGALVEKTGAKFKSDDRALELIQKARVAIGGDSAIKSIQSMRIVGETTRSFKGDGQARSEKGQTEIAFQFPDKMMKSTSIGGNAEARGVSSRSVEHTMNVTVAGNEPGEIKLRVNAAGAGEGHGAGPGPDIHIVVKKDDGTTQELSGADAEKWIAAHHPEGDGPVKIFVQKSDGTTETVNGNGARLGEPMDGGIVVRKMKGGDGEPAGEMHTKLDGNNVYLTRGDAHAGGMVRNNDMLRMSLSLLLTAPAGMDVEYLYGGDGDVDGTACNIVIASFGGQTYRLYLDKSSNLPVAVKYKGASMPQVFTFTRNAGEPGERAETRVNTLPRTDGDKVVTFTTKVPEGAEGEKGNVMFRRMEVGPSAGTEYTVKFSDYRSVNGVQLPYTWTQIGGEADETFVVTNYDVNPANIADKFQGQKVMLRTSKPVDK
jgi:hypothetical protein